jgi:biopolymer transport protein ExbD
MNFRRGSFREEPEINLVPFIDILIVIVIFLAVTTTYSRYAELKINLPTADANQAEQLPDQIDVAVASDGQYMINQSRIVFTTTSAFAAELQAASGGKRRVWPASDASPLPPSKRSSAKQSKDPEMLGPHRWRTCPLLPDTLLSYVRVSARCLTCICWKNTGGASRL